MNEELPLPRELAEIAFDGIIICDLARNIRYANPAARALYGWAGLDLDGRSLEQFSIDPVVHMANWQSLLTTGAWQGEIGRTTSSGDVVLAAGRRVVVGCALSPDACVIEFTKATSVLDSGLVVELRGQADRNAQLIRHLPIPLWQIDTRPAHRALAMLRDASIRDHACRPAALTEIAMDVMEQMVVLDSNLSAASMMRTSEQGIRAIRFSRILEDRDVVSKFVSSLVEERQNFVAETQLRATDETMVDIVLSTTLLETDDLSGLMYVMATDVTDKNRATRQLRKLEMNYSHAARVSTLGELASSIAHEVKQPLAAIRATSEASQTAAFSSAPDLNRIVGLTERILANAHRANDVILRIRGMAMKREPVCERVGLPSLLREACLFVEHEVKTKRIAFEVDVPDELPAVSGDPVQLQQVFVNLLVNAVQAVSKRGEADRRVSLRSYAARGNVLIDVEDSGDGIDEADLPRVFDGFFSTKVDGVGLGLSISRTLVDAHNGAIEVSSAPGRGSRFRVRLPACEQPAMVHDMT